MLGRDPSDAAVEFPSQPLTPASAKSAAPKPWMAQVVVQGRAAPAFYGLGVTASRIRTKSREGTSMWFSEVVYYPERVTDKRHKAGFHTIF